MMINLNILLEYFRVKMYLWSENMSLFQSEYELKVSFEDLDPMNVVWHGNYLRYLEQARCDLLSKLKYTYIDMKNDGFIYPVAKLKVKYIKSATLDDVLVVKLDIISIEPTLDIKYRIFDKNTNKKIFEAKTMQICFDINKNESVYVPPKNFIKSINEASNEKNN